MKTSACPYIISAFDLLSKKWTGVIVHTIAQQENNRAHFNTLKATIDNITPRVLSMRLNELIEEDIIVRVEDDSHHAYELTQKGTDLVDALRSIENWAHTYIKL